MKEFELKSIVELEQIVKLGGPLASLALREIAHRENGRLPRWSRRLRPQDYGISKHVP